MATAAKEVNKEKLKALELTMEKIDKTYGKGTIMRLGEGAVIEDIQVVSTGSLGLDIALGVGGLPRGRVVEIYGPESSGKTTLTLQVIAEMQKLTLTSGRAPCRIETHAWGDLVWARGATALALAAVTDAALGEARA